MDQIEMLMYALEQMKSSHSSIGVDFNGNNNVFDRFYSIKTPSQMKKFTENHSVECKFEPAKCDYDNDTYIIVVK